MPNDLPQPATGSRTNSEHQPSAEAVAIGAIFNAFPAYGTETERAVERGIWIKNLRRFGAKIILAAWARYQINGPRDDRSGKLVRPDLGAITQRCNAILREAARQRPALPEPEPEREPRVTADQTAAIMAEVGFDPSYVEPREPQAPAFGSPAALAVVRAANPLVQEAIASQRATAPDC